MAVYRYATKDLSITNAEAFKAALSASDGRSTKNSVILYVCIGRTNPWPNEPTPENPPDNEQYLHYEVMRRMIGAKKVTTGDVSHVIPRYDWTSGTVYSMYRDTDTDMYERAWYVLTDENNVYICLYNNKGAQSTIKPTGFSTLPFTTSDGYTWKYLYTISLGDAQKFMTAVHMPVKTITAADGSIESSRQLAVQNAAVNGAILVVETNQTGSGYYQVANAAVVSAGVNTLRISATANPETTDNFYNGSSVYVTDGTGAGQLRRIINWSGSTRTLTVNTAFATVCNTDSRVIISPTVTIIGDGQGAKAYSLVDTSTGAIANVAVINVGSGYTRAQALITANSTHGAGATANVIISPLGGHGHDPIRNLHGDKLMLNVQFNGSEGQSNTGKGYIPSNTEFRTISILRDPVLKVDANNDIVSVEHIANTSNSPATLRLTTRFGISYLSPELIGNIVPNNILTNLRNYNRAVSGKLEFVTQFGTAARTAAALSNAVLAANCNVVYARDDETVDDSYFQTLYINSVESYSDYPAFTKDDVLLKSTSATPLATVESISGPEANTFSGEIIFTENVQAVTRDPDQIEDIKIILDF